MISYVTIALVVSLVSLLISLGVSEARSKALKALTTEDGRAEQAAYYILEGTDEQNIAFLATLIDVREAIGEPLELMEIERDLK